MVVVVVAVCPLCEEVEWRVHPRAYTQLQAALARWSRRTPAAAACVRGIAAVQRMTMLRSRCTCWLHPRPTAPACSTLPAAQACSTRTGWASVTARTTRAIGSTLRLACGAQAALKVRLPPVRPAMAQCTRSPSPQTQRTLGRPHDRRKPCQDRSSTDQCRSLLVGRSKRGDIPCWAGLATTLDTVPIHRRPAEQW